FSAKSINPRFRSQCSERQAGDRSKERQRTIGVIARPCPVLTDVKLISHTTAQIKTKIQSILNATQRYKGLLIAGNARSTRDLDLHALQGYNRSTSLDRC